MAETIEQNEVGELSRAEKDEILRTARARWDRGMDRERDNIKLAYDDLEFLAGNQWPQEVAETRNNESRPVLTNNQMPQFVHQVTGDFRKMRPAIKVVGVDDQADPKLAELREGMVRYIENRSDAPGAYFSAGDSQVACGIGHCRVITEYADDTTFEQEIRIEGVDDGVAVLWDPDAKRQTREDANWCFVPVDYTTDTFRENWPDASMAEFEDVRNWQYYGDWKTDEKVRVAEYWVKKPKTLILALTQQGQIIDCTEDEEDGSYTAKEKQAILKANGARIEKRESYVICRYLVTAADVLEYQEWPGRFIPIVPFLGEEIKIGRKIIRRGIIRDAKDAQRQYNYFSAAHTEVVALQPKAPFMVTETNVAKYQSMWEQANVKNFPYLLYSPDPKNGNAPPQRVQPAVSSQGITDGLTLANENMRRIIGIYDASLGARSNETSGVAIEARDEQGDTGTIVYRDNFVRAIRQVGKIVVDLIPHIYDTQRTIRVMGEDGKIDLMQINQEKDHAGQPIIDPRTLQPMVLNDISAGAYDVVAEAGTSFTTKREEASASMLEFLKTMPDTAPLVGDLVAKVQDWPMADKFAERLHAALPPPILEAEKAKEQEETGQPPQPDPQAEIAAQAQQAQLELGMQKMQAETAESVQRARKAEADAAKAEADAETARVQTQIAMQQLGKTEIEVAGNMDERAAKQRREDERHAADLARGGERHQFDMARDTDDHLTALERGEAEASRADEAHQAKIRQMKQPKEAPRA